MLTIEMDLANGQYFHYAADHGILSNAVVVGHQVGQDILILLQFQLDHCALVALLLGLGGGVGNVEHHLGHLVPEQIGLGGVVGKAEDNVAVVAGGAGGEDGNVGGAVCVDGRHHRHTAVGGNGVQQLLLAHISIQAGGDGGGGDGVGAAVGRGGGAFTGIVVTTFLADAIPSPVLRLTVAMLLAAVAAAIVGVIVGIPVLRLKGDYLAIVTLAFGEIIKNIINVLYVGMDDRGLHFSIVKQTFTLNEGGDMIINGPIGVSGIDKISNFTAGFILILITLFIVLNLINSRHGRAVMAVRDNRIAADSVGISTTRFKLMAFVISAAFAGMAGTLYAMN